MHRILFTCVLFIVFVTCLSQADIKQVDDNIQRDVNKQRDGDKQGEDDKQEDGDMQGDDNKQIHAEHRNDYSEQMSEHKCTGRYELYNRCGPACPATCTNILQPDRACIALCVPGCFCKPGYVRNRWNTCILQEKCPCKNHYEIFRCGSACQTTCEDLHKPCPIQNIKCNDTCYCVDGYARDSTGKCIPIEQCPKKTLNVVLKEHSPTPITYK